jgi:hypothetical protein
MPKTPPTIASTIDSTSTPHQPPSRSTQGDANGSLRAILQAAREHQIHQVRAGHQQHTSRGDQQQLEPILVLIPHDLHACAARDQAHRLLASSVASSPAFERPRIYSRAHSSNQVQEVIGRPVQAGRFTVDSVVPPSAAATNRAYPHPASFVP